MEPLLQRLLNILVAPPGNLIFHLVLVFSILASLQSIWIARQSSSYRNSGRMLFGLGMLLVGQVLLFAGSGLAWQGVLDPHVLLPPADRAVMVFSLVWIVWLWVFPRPARLGDLVTGFLILGVVIVFVFTLVSWQRQAAVLSFNNHPLDLVWELSGLVIVLTGMAILLFARPVGWGFGLGMLSLSLAGILGHLAAGDSTADFSGIIRLSQLAAFPLLPTLMLRLNAPRTGVEMFEPPKKTKTAASSALLPQVERRRYSSDMRTVHAFLELKEKEEAGQVVPAMAKAVAHTMLADLCFIATTPEYGQVTLLAGYDLVREGEVNGTFLDQDQVPLIASALLKGKGMRIVSGDTQPDDLRVIADALGLKEPGTLLLVPLGIGDKPWGGILLLSPYSNRQWAVDDQNYLASEAERIVVILNRARQKMWSLNSSADEAARQAPKEDTSKALLAEIARVKQANQDLGMALEQTRQELEELRQQPASAPTPELDALIALQKESQEMIAALQAENERLQKVARDQALAASVSIPTSTAAPDSAATVEIMRLETDLRSSLQDLAVLQNKLAEANAKILMFERQTNPAALYFIEDRELFTSMVQDLRQPMVSIMGYTDLLLAESVGILGGLQRKFLERVRASAERMRLMLNDLIQANTPGGATRDLLHRPVELGSIIDSAMLDTSAQMREKDITLRVDLPREMPVVHAGRDSIQQILVHLLQNAGAVSPEEGSITLRARVQKENDENKLLLQVVDSGGGIAPQFLADVFTPRFRAENPLIEGLGDTGAGLSIAKSLAESHGGRIWVETGGGHTTFSVLFPLSTSSIEKALG